MKLKKLDSIIISLSLSQNSKCEVIILFVRQITFCEGRKLHRGIVSRKGD